MIRTHNPWGRFSGGLLALAALFALIAAPVCQAKAPDFPIPKKAELRWVSQNMVMNGIPSQVREFNTKEKPEKITEFYQEKWEELDGKKPGYVYTDAMAPWQLITRVEDNYLMTVQYQQTNKGGTWGYLAISPLPDKDAQPSQDNLPPAMRGSQVMSSISSADSGQEGHTVLMHNDYSVQSNINFYKQHYSRDGWGVKMDKSVSGGKIHTLAFKKRRTEVNIVIMGTERESQVVYNEISHDLLF